MNARSFCLGIDLGTTHCALASTQHADDAPEPFGIHQVVAPFETSARVLLPSFLYLPAPGQFAPAALGLPWNPLATSVVGDLARTQGVTSPGRLVASAKSWLSHGGADRRGPILPSDAAQDVTRISPLEASARYLQHLRAAWDHAHPDAPLRDQDVVLTVPASFDPTARELTVEAARLAGLPETLTLLEEPQAAVYDWIATHGEDWRREVEVGDVLLVVDIGGGTTDFSLIAVGEDAGNLVLERIAVGEHILLGGDNMDLALAHACAQELEDRGQSVDEAQLTALAHACRSAKEALVGENAPETFPVAVLGRGSRLFGNTLRVDLTRAHVETLLVDGFFPRVDREANLAASPRIGLTGLGLPYPSDPAITRHLAAFLRKSEEARGYGFPTKVLWNGGVTQAPRFRERLLEVLSSWRPASQTQPLRVLSGTDPELAVARGAAYYARARRGAGVRIRGGSAQAHYLGVERPSLAVPGVRPKIDAICIAPRGLEEGEVVALPRTLGLVLGEPVTFRFFGSAGRATDALGDTAPLSELVELAPLQVELPGDAGHVAKVRLEAVITPIGTLELSAVDLETSARWHLTFDVRGRRSAPS